MSLTELSDKINAGMAKRPRDVNSRSAQDNPLVVWLLATGAPWYTGKRQIHEVLGVTFFAEHIRTLTKRFDLKLCDVCVEPLSSAVS